MMRDHERDAGEDQSLQGKQHADDEGEAEQAPVELRVIEREVEKKHPPSRMTMTATVPTRKRATPRPSQ